MDVDFQRQVEYDGLTSIIFSISQIYDLKGNIRNRLVNSTGRANEVLLDENLVQSE
jgi:hypothetical protein